MRKEDTEDVWQMLHPGVERRAHQRSEYCKDNRVPQCLHRNFWKDYNSLRNPILPTAFFFVESCSIKDFQTVIIYKGSFLSHDVVNQLQTATSGTLLCPKYIREGFFSLKIGV